MILRNMAKVALPEHLKLPVLRRYCHENRAGEVIQNYLYVAGTGMAYLPLNRHKLNEVATLLGTEIRDERAQGEPLTTEFVLNPYFQFRPHQVAPAPALLDEVRTHQYAVLKAPCSCGKTVVMTWVAGHLGKKILVLVDQGNLAGQWQEAFRMVWNHDAHILDKKMDLSNDVVIATFQFLREHPELVARMKEMFGTCLIDEFHAAGAKTYRTTLFSLSNFYRIGTSATVMRKGFSAEILTDLVADVSVEMVDDKALVPQVRFVKTEVPLYSNHPDDFTKTLTALAENDQRNRLLVELIRQGVAEGRKILFIGARITALKYLHGELSKFCKAVCYTGSTTLKQDQALRTGLEEGSIEVILTDKKAEKGLDLPRLDMVIIAKMMNNQATITQIAGRVLRPSPGKPQPLIVDLVDHGQLAWLFARHRHGWYEDLGYEFEQESYFFLDRF